MFFGSEKNDFGLFLFICLCCTGFSGLVLLSPAICNAIPPTFPWKQLSIVLFGINHGINILGIHWVFGLNVLWLWKYEKELRYQIIKTGWAMFFGVFLCGFVWFCVVLCTKTVVWKHGTQIQFSCLAGLFCLISLSGWIFYWQMDKALTD